MKPYNGNDPYIFISYAHRDQKAPEVIKRLIEDGYRVWYDEGIDPGTEWAETIAVRIRDCSHFIALISGDYLVSENCKDELELARDLVKNRLLVYLEDVELTLGQKMRFNRIQNISRHKYETAEDFYQKFYKTVDLDRCKSVNVKPVYAKNSTEGKTVTKPAAANSREEIPVKETAQSSQSKTVQKTDAERNEDKEKLFRRYENSRLENLDDYDLEEFARLVFFEGFDQEFDDKTYPSYLLQFLEGRADLDFTGSLESLVSEIRAKSLSENSKKQNSSAVSKQSSTETEKANPNSNLPKKTDEKKDSIASVVNTLKGINKKDGSGINADKTAKAVPSTTSSTTGKTLRIQTTTGTKSADQGVIFSGKLDSIPKEFKDLTVDEFARLVAPPGVLGNKTPEEEKAIKQKKFDSYVKKKELTYLNNRELEEFARLVYLEGYDSPQYQINYPNNYLKVYLQKRAQEDPSGRLLEFLSELEKLNESGKSHTANRKVTVTLTAAGKDKINLIKTVRKIRGCGLREAKTLVDSTPSVIKSNISSVEASRIVSQLMAVGATAKIS